MVSASTPSPSPSPRGRSRKLADAPMARYSSWQTGGRAQLLYFPVDLADLQAELRRAELPPPIVFIGLGSNLLIREGGFRGTLCRLVPGLAKITKLEGGFRAEAGVSCPRLARSAAAAQLVGAEFLVGIPGSIGGALAMNAGCFGAQIWDFVSEAEVLAEDGSLDRVGPADFDIGYRRVVAKRAVPLRFIAASFVWPRACGSKVASARELLQQRNRTQPIGTANAGSVFTNPQGDFAGRLIEAAGLAGTREGGAMVSAKHANFIINTGTASATDIERLIERMRTAVRDNFGVLLNPEVRIIGEPR